MENLGFLFQPTRFAAVFDAANRDAARASKPRQSVMWLEGGLGDLVATDAARAVSRSIEALCVRVKRKMAGRAA